MPSPSFPIYRLIWTRGLTEQRQPGLPCPSLSWCWERLTCRSCWRCGCCTTPSSTSDNTGGCALRLSFLVAVSFVWSRTHGVYSALRYTSRGVIFPCGRSFAERVWLRVMLARASLCLVSQACMLRSSSRHPFCCSVVHWETPTGSSAWIGATIYRCGRLCINLVSSGASLVLLPNAPYDDSILRLKIQELCV